MKIKHRKVRNTTYIYERKMIDTFLGKCPDNCPECNPLGYKEKKFVSKDGSDK